MKARLFNTSKFRLVCACMLSVCLAFVFSSNSFATNFKDGSATFSVSFYKPIADRTYFNYIGSQTLNSGSPTTYDSTTNIGQYQFNISQPSGCDNICRITINWFEFVPANIVNNNWVYPTGDYVHIKAWSLHNFFQGTMDTIWGNSADKYISVLGGDSWLGTSLSNHHSCRDAGSDVCNVLFWQNNTDYDELYLYHGFSVNTARSLSPSTNWISFHVSLWQYDLTNHQYLLNNTGGPMMFIPKTNPIVFYVKAWDDDQLASVDDEGAEDLQETSPDFDSELDLINNNGTTAQNSADSLNVGFSVPWIFQTWFSLFVNSDCVNIPNLQTMLHSTQSSVCTPWSSNLRSILSPIFAILSSMLAFGFVIRWLSRGSKQEME